MTATATIYVNCARKAWHYGDLFHEWTCTHEGRFNYIECYIFEKPVDELSANDRELWHEYGERPREWVEPSPCKEVLV